MTIEALCSKVIGSEELKTAFVAAVKENKVAEFLKEQGCEATEAEVVEFLKSKQNAEGEVSDAELDAVSAAATVRRLCILCSLPVCSVRGLLF